MMEAYCINYMPEVFFGRKTRNKLHEKLSAFDKKLLLCGKHFHQSRFFEELFSGRDDYIIHECASSEPTLKSLGDALLCARQHQVGAVVAIGGGSVIDTGKAVSALLYQPGNIQDYFYNRLDFSSERVFFCALPTTAGTGAEVTPNAVFTDELNGIKQSLRGRVCGVDLAIVDPELTYDCPLNVIRWSGMDSLTQAIEGAVSRRANNVTLAWSMRAFELVLNNLENACNGDLSAKDAVAEGTMLGALAFTYSGLGAVHGLAHPLGSVCHLPHGLVCGVLLPHILEINFSALVKLADTYYNGRVSATEIMDKVKKLASKLEIPCDFKGYLKKEDFDFIIKNCRSGSMKCNPVELTDEDIAALLEKMA